MRGRRRELSLDLSARPGQPRPKVRRHAKGVERDGVRHADDGRIRGPLREPRRRLHRRFESYTEDADLAEFFRGLPDDRCQCPHWGYVMKGKVTYKFADRDETYEAGDAYYVPAGHTPSLHAGTELIEFSPTAALDETIGVVVENLRAPGVEI